MKAEQHTEKTLFQENIFVYEYVLVHVKNKWFHHRPGETEDSINRVTLSREMAVLPQDEALQLQPALACSPDKTDNRGTAVSQDKDS